MPEKPETPADALANARTILKEDSWIDEVTLLDEDGEPDDYAQKVVRMSDMAEAIDRIEAAVERERAKYERLHECFWNVDSIQSIVRQMLDERDDLRDKNPQASEVAAHFAQLLTKAATPAPGNTLKMREALEWVDRFFSYDGSGTSTDAANLAIEASTKTREALAAPARNCDVGDAAEQSERLAKFCKTNYEKAKKDKHICSECQFNDCIGERPLEWSQMPYAPAEGGDHA